MTKEEKIKNAMDKTGDIIEYLEQEVFNAECSGDNEKFDKLKEFKSVILDMYCLIEEQLYMEDKVE